MCHTFALASGSIKLFHVTKRAKLDDIYALGLETGVEAFVVGDRC